MGSLLAGMVVMLEVKFHQHFPNMIHGSCSKERRTAKKTDHLLTCARYAHSCGRRVYGHHTSCSHPSLDIVARWVQINSQNLKNVAPCSGFVCMPIRHQWTSAHYRSQRSTGTIETVWHVCQHVLHISFHRNRYFSVTPSGGATAV